jgi:hypothetical protein
MLIQEKEPRSATEVMVWACEEADCGHHFAEQKLEGAVCSIPKGQQSILTILTGFVIFPNSYKLFYFLKSSICNYVN